MSIKEQESFWIFFFDGPHPSTQNKLYNKVLNELLECNKKKMMSIVEKAYKKVVVNWNDK